MRKSIIEQATENYLNSRAIMIDQELFKFLGEQGVTEANTLDDIQKALKDKNLELVREYKEGESGEVHTFKLCRVYAQHEFNIPKIQINVL